MANQMSAPALNLGCNKGAVGFMMSACDACVVRSGAVPPGVQFSPKTNVGRVPIIRLCAGQMLCSVRVGISEAFSEDIPFTLGSYVPYCDEVNYAQCLEEGDEGWVDPFDKDAIFGDAKVDLTTDGCVIDIPVGKDGKGHIVGKDDIIIYAEFEKAELSDYEKGVAKICIEVCP